MLDKPVIDIHIFHQLAISFLNDIKKTVIKIVVVFSYKIIIEI